MQRTSAAKEKTTRERAAGNRWLWLRRVLFLLAMVLAVGNSFFNPLFEAPDELEHTQFVYYLLEESRLPVQPTDGTLTQYHQPPLYYVVGATLVSGVEGDLVEPLSNPFWLSYRPEAVHRDNKAQFLPQTAYEPPYRGTALVVHILRFWSLILLAGTLLIFWAIGREVWPGRERRQTLFFAVAGLNPMLLYISSSANNDNLVILLGSLLLLLVIRAIRRGFSPATAALIGLVWGLACLSKLTGLFLIVPWVVILLWFGWQQGSWRRAALYLAISVAVGLLLSGWWFLRNVQLYGELFALETMLDNWGERPAGSRNLTVLITAIQYALESFWGRLGYGQVVFPGVVYWLFAALTLAGVVGVLARWRALVPALSTQEAEIWLALSATAAVYLPALAYFLWRNPTGANGRYAFPALAALAAFVVAGLSALPLRRYLRAGTILFLAGASVFALGWLVPWTYAEPETIQEQALPPGLDGADTHSWEPGMRLLGTALESRDLSGMERQEVALRGCWRAETRPGRNYVFYVHVVDHDLRPLGQRDTHTGLGTAPTSMWEAGDVFCETYRVPLDTAELNTAQVASVTVGFYDATTREPLQAFDDVASPVEFPIVARVKVGVPLTASGTADEVLASFAEGLSLQDYEWSADSVPPGETITLRVRWRASGPTSVSYTVFAHLLNEDGEIMAQDDQLPRNGRYPTDFWGAGELIVDEHTFTVAPDAAPGSTSVRLGFYTLPENRRLPREDGSDLPDAVEIPGPVIVE